MFIEVQGVDAAIKAIEKYKYMLNGRYLVFLQRLAEVGIETAEIRLKNAIYSGVFDAVIEPFEWISPTQLVISATGKSITFIEFGTGITYPDDHPKAAELGMVRGEYGKGKGSRPFWTYVGYPGNNGEIIHVKESGDYVIKTQGNPANRIMYDAGQTMRRKVVAIAKEVFGV